MTQNEMTPVKRLLRTARVFVFNPYDGVGPERLDRFSYLVVIGEPRRNDWDAARLLPRYLSSPFVYLSRSVAIAKATAHAERADAKIVDFVHDMTPAQWRAAQEAIRHAV